MVVFYGVEYRKSLLITAITRVKHVIKHVTVKARSVFHAKGTLPNVGR